MKITSELKKRRIPIVKIDEGLNQYDDKVLFPEKLEKANDMLRKIGLPKQWIKKIMTNNLLNFKIKIQKTGEF